MTAKPACRLVILAALLSFIVGCSSVGVIRVTQQAPSTTPNTARPVELFKLEDSPGKPYEIIGVVSACFYIDYGADRHPPDGVVKRMKSKAAALGADALVQYYHNAFSARPSSSINEAWASALAVKYQPTGAPTPQERLPLFVVIPPAVEISLQGKPNPLMEDQFSIAAQKCAQMHLTDSGFFALLTTNRLSTSFTDTNQPPQPSALEQFGDPTADLILEIRIAERGGPHLSPFTAGPAVQVALYSKSCGKVIWLATSKGRSVPPDFQKLELLWNSLSHVFIKNLKPAKELTKTN